MRCVAFQNQITQERYLGDLQHASSVLLAKLGILIGEVTCSVKR